MYYFIKVLISALLIVAISEAGKRFATLGAIIASIPLTSLLAFVWLYIDTGDKTKVSQLSWEVLLMVIPSLAFFIALPLLLRSMKFYPALFLSAAITAVAYFGWMNLVKRLGWIA